MAGRDGSSGCTWLTIIFLHLFSTSCVRSIVLYYKKLVIYQILLYKLSVLPKPAVRLGIFLFQTPTSKIQGSVWWLFDHLIFAFSNDSKIIIHNILENSKPAIHNLSLAVSETSKMGIRNIVSFTIRNFAFNLRRFH